MADAEHVISIILRAKNMATAEINAAASQITGLGASINQIGTQMQRAGGGMMGVGGLITGVIGATSKAAMEYSGATKALVTGAGESQAAIEGVSRGILAMAGQVGKSPVELAQGMYMVESAGYRGAAGLEVLKASAMGAKVGMTDMPVMANAVTSALNSYGLGGEQAARVTNTLIATVANGKMQMADLAGSMGKVLPSAAAASVGLDEVGAAIATMTGQGTDAGTAATSLAALMARLQVSTGPAQQALEGIGLTSQQVGNTLTSQGLLPALKLIQEHMDARLPRGSAAANAALIQIFGGAESGSKVLQLMNGNLATFETTLQSTSAAFQSNSTEITGWSTISGGAGMQIARLKANLDAATIQLGQAFLPAIAAAAGSIMPLIQQIGQWAAAHQPLIASVMVTAAVLLIGGGAALVFGGTAIKAGLALGGLVVNAYLTSVSILRLIGGMVLWVAQAAIATTRALILAGAWVVGQIAANGFGGMLTNLIGVVAQAGAAFLRLAGTVLAAAGSMLGPLLVGIAVVAALYLAWRNNWFGMREVVDNVVAWIGDKLLKFGDFLNKIRVSLGMTAVDWKAGWENIKKTAADGATGIGNVIGNIGNGMMPQIDLSQLGTGNLAEQIATATNLPIATGLLPGEQGPGGLPGNVAPILQDTGTKMSELASAAQTAISGIGQMAQSAIDASIGLGGMPGVDVAAMMKPGANGPFEDIYRLQDVAKNGEASPWAAKLGVGQAEAADVVTKFQKGMLMDPAVQKFINVEQLRGLVGQQAEGQNQIQQFAQFVGGDPALIQKLLGGQGYNVTPGQAQTLADAAREGTLQLLAKGSFDQVAATNANTTTVASAVTTGTGNIVTSLAELKMQLGTVLPSGMPGQVPTMPAAVGWNTLNGLLGLGPKPPEVLPPALRPGDVPLDQRGPASYLPGHAPGDVPLDQRGPASYLPGHAPGELPNAAVTAGTGTITATRPAGGQTNNISVTIGSGALQIDGNTGYDGGLPGRLSKFLSGALQAFAQSESRRPASAPVGIPGNP